MPSLTDSIEVREASETEISEHGLTRTSRATLRHGNSVSLLPNGERTYESWLEAIRCAREWVHFENYIFKSDTIGQRLADAFIERARAGVRVRVLYDWYGSWDVPNSFWESLRAGGVDVRVVNPPQAFDPLAVLRRDHRKLLAVDGTYASVGGVGVADAWLQHDEDTGLPYRDTCVAVSGPAVADIEEAFAGVWALNGAALPAAERPASDSIAATGEMPVRVVIQEPGKMRIARVLQLLAAEARHRMWIADPYFLADNMLREALIAAARDGVDVRLLLPSTNDLRIVGAVSRMSYRPLLEAGARIWEYRGPMMHAKTSITDGRVSRIGSTNLNITGLMTNWELDVIVEDHRFGTQMEEMFLADLDDARELQLEGRRVSGGLPRSRGRMRHLARGTGAQVPTTVASFGGALAQGALSNMLSRNDRNVHLAVGGGALFGAAVIAWLPRTFAWTLATLTAAVGVSEARRAFRGRDE